MTVTPDIQDGVAEVDVPPAGTPVGEHLREAREALGLRVDDIAQALKLGRRQVEALEAGDWEQLPGVTFTRGFVRNYARLVHVDPAGLMTQLDRVLVKPTANLDVPETELTTMPDSGPGASRRDRLVVLVGAALLLLAAVAYFLMPNDLSELRSNTQALLDSASSRTEAPAPAAPPAAEPVFPPGVTPQQVLNPQAVVPPELQPAPAAATPPATVAASPVAIPQPAAPSAAVPAAAPSAPAAVPTAVGGPQMRFVFDKESWLEVRDRDNHLVFSQRVPGGREETLSGRGPLSIVIGYAPGVRLFWRNQPVDLAPHTRGDVARFVLE